MAAIRAGLHGYTPSAGIDELRAAAARSMSQLRGFEIKPVAAELTYGLERIAMYLQGVENVFDVEWVKGVKYREVFHRNEVEMSEYSFRAADPKMLFGLFDVYEAECKRLLAEKLPLPAYDYCLKCSHAFNNLDDSSRMT